ncbi:MAG: hypothetical protein KME64_33470 [Scytonematopsis contorta HA4267-MV1]|jgi:hypothetical protein|nr:hypothetical protein [Scytonematopsis contorta HA4267-MV1]
MTSKELLIQEIESLPSELLTQALDFIRFIKVSHSQKELKTDNTSNSGNVPQSEKNPYPLRGKVLYYEDPTEPVALEDWEFLQ